ncbi:hypothetical protein V2S04_11265 [Microbacterium sp. OR21]|uniref:hypothetical protein n=1 Tax=Microbacterium sp. OR21 TaxID=3095346 RepID=UPI0039B4C328
MTFFEQVPDPSRGSRPRRSGARGARTAALLLLMAAVTLGGLWLVSEDSASDEPLLSRILPGLSAAPPALDDEFAALADRMVLTPEGREVLASTQPRFVDAGELAEVCGSDSHGTDDTILLGCFTGFSQSRAQDRIVILEPTDDLIGRSLVTTAAHELLHAVFARMPGEEQSRIADLAAAATARLAADDPVHEQIAASMGGDEASRATEQFAYLGSQMRLDPVHDAELEEIYARTFEDRTAILPR